MSEAFGMSAFISRSNTISGWIAKRFKSFVGDGARKSKELVSNLNSKWTNPIKSKWATPNNYLQNTPVFSIGYMGSGLNEKKTSVKTPCLKFHSVWYFVNISWYGSHSKLSTKKHNLKQKNFIHNCDIFLFTLLFFHLSIPWSPWKLVLVMVLQHIFSIQSLGSFG